MVYHIVHAAHAEETTRLSKHGKKIVSERICISGTITDTVCGHYPSDFYFVALTYRPSVGRICQNCKAWFPKKRLEAYENL
jgi:hypothetical protein